MAETHERMVEIGLMQLAEWARSYVENETTIPELKMGQMSPAEVAALALMGAILSRRVG